MVLNSQFSLSLRTPRSECRERDIKICELKQNRGLLEKFVKESREKTEVKIEELAEIIGISKSSIGRISKTKKMGVPISQNWEKRTVPFS